MNAILIHQPGPVLTLQNNLITELLSPSDAESQSDDERYNQLPFEENEAATACKSGCDKEADEQRAARQVLFSSWQYNTSPFCQCNLDFFRSLRFARGFGYDTRFLKQPLCDVTKGSKCYSSLPFPLKICTTGCFLDKSEWCW